MIENLTLSGKSTLREWKPGALQKWMDGGFNLKHSQILARKCGDLIAEHTVQNLVVTAGKELIAEFCLNNAPNGLLYHAIGTGATAPAAGDVALGTEANRKLWTLTSRAGAVVSLSVFYLAAESTFNIKEAGIFGGLATATPDSGSLFSHYLQAVDNSGAIKDLTFDYELTIGA